MTVLTGSAASAITVLVLWAAVAAAAVPPANPTAPPQAHQIAGARLLDVPYLPQTEDLCGGAAVAMVLRYWGERQIYPEDFAHLVDRSASGIRTDVLAAEAGRRGWQSFPLNADAESGGEWIRGQVDLGRPIVALVEIRPDRYHYVVIVAWTGEHVIVHDPAREPFRVMSHAEFDGAWARTDRWALLLLPRNDRPADTGTPPESATTGAAPATDTCGALVREMVERARAGDLASAETGLLAAARLCPGDAAVWRELAGVRFLQSRWDEAGALAERATALEPGDEQGWDLLATSHFLNDDPVAALRAWNRIGRPSIDVVRVHGLRRTRHPVAVALIDLPPRTLLTPERYGRAARRLDELPSAALTRLRYQPIDGGLTEIEAAVVERPTVPRGVVPLAATTGRAWLHREVRLDVASPAGSGELWTVAWRWWEARPRLAFGLAVPLASWLPGVTAIEGFWERPSYQIPSADGPGTPAIHRDARRRAALSFADWAGSHLRWKAGAALDRWARDSHLSVDAAFDLRLAGDRVSIGIDTTTWTPIGSGGSFARGGISAAWRSTRHNNRPGWSTTAGLAATSAAAPFDVWPGAGTGHARTPLLRAHPLLDRGVVSGPVFGRRLAHGTIEYQHPIVAAPAGAVRLAAFADAAKAWRRVDDGPSALQVDLGAGVRLALPGSGGTMRVDVGRGLRDGRGVVSAGWEAAWPGRQ